MPSRHNLFLIGYRCTGKSTIGRLLAECLGWKFVDPDVLLEQRLGRTIREVFATEGEVGFRDREEALLAEICQGRDQVIATGGGIVLRPTNRERLQNSGTVIWLTADVDTIWQRLQQDSTTSERRPNLTVGGRREIEDLLRQREPLYHCCAHRIVSTVGRSPEAIADDIWTAWTHA